MKFYNKRKEKFLEAKAKVNKNYKIRNRWKEINLLC